jgi:MoxR-like ATPase
MSQPNADPSPELQSEAESFREMLAAVRQEVGKIMVGQQGVVESVLTALLCGGNVLLEGVPGLGKTELVKSLSRVLKLDFQRIQFTPDLMPADIIGTNIMTNDAAGHYQFEFRKGPVFTQLLLADEINRASPKTQSALLEAMQERTVTAGGKIRKLRAPYFVMATQNPIEQEGTYPLPEAQLDRFLFKIQVPFPSCDDLNEVVNRTILKTPLALEQIVDGEGILQMRQTLEKVVVADPMRDYAVRMVLATHPETEYTSEPIQKFVRWGASPRAAQALVQAGRVRALSDGRAHVAFEDLQHFAKEVLQHRVLLNYDGQAENVDVGELIDQLVRQLALEV